jgi:DNA (cytosine-5)-methyltransferase 1
MDLGSCFSGIGGFELGAERCGIKTKWCIEINTNLHKILKKYTNVIYNDIQTVSKLPKVDIITGGVPCQDISRANSEAKGIRGERSGLWNEMYRIICNIRPSYIVIENVAMLTHRGLDRILCNIAAIRYNAEWACLQANWFGYPHERKRIFVVAYPGSRRQHKNKIFTKEYYERIFKKTVCNVELDIFNEIFKNTTKKDGVYNNQNVGISEKLLIKTVEQIKALGNAVIPDIAESIFLQIQLNELQFFSQK